MTTYYHQPRHGGLNKYRNRNFSAFNEEAISYQPYRTTPLILPGAKVKKDNNQTESYLRHHPNPGMRAGPPMDYQAMDAIMKQKAGDSVLARVVGNGSPSGKVVHKQFNSPIGLYSDQNIENTIKQTVPINGSLLSRPTKLEGYKKTLVYDPSKSETYRAIQEQNHGDYSHESIQVPAVQQKTYSPNRLIPGKKPAPYNPPQNPHYLNVNNLGESNETIHQSGSFKRLMYSVLGETDY